MPGQTTQTGCVGHPDPMLISRKEWGARAPKSTESVRSTKGVKVHYTGGHVPSSITEEGNHHICQRLVRTFQNQHMDANGWADLAYNMVACPHGHVFIGRGPHRLTAANGPGRNADHYSVLALLGNAGFVFPNDALLSAIWDAIDYLRENGNAGREVKGHRDGYATDCPGEHLYAWIQSGAPRPGADRPAGKDAGKTAAKAAATSRPKWPGRLLTYPPLMRGDDVRTWQAQAKKLGYTIAVDGVYGPQSKKVCRQLQKDKGVTVDGIVGPETWTVTFR